ARPEGVLVVEVAGGVDRHSFVPHRLVRLDPLDPAFRRGRHAVSSIRVATVWGLRPSGSGVARDAPGPGRARIRRRGAATRASAKHGSTSSYSSATRSNGRHVGSSPML